MSGLIECGARLNRLAFAIKSGDKKAIEEANSELIEAEKEQALAVEAALAKMKKLS